MPWNIYIYIFVFCINKVQNNKRITSTIYTCFLTLIFVCCKELKEGEDSTIISPGVCLFFWTLKKLVEYSRPFYMYRFFETKTQHTVEVKILKMEC